MQQFIQSQPNLQQPFAELAMESKDVLITLPSGMGWFEAFSPNALLNPNALAVAIYPSQSLLQHHLFRMRLQGFQGKDFAALTSDMPPHAERDVWERVAQAKLSLVMMTARKFQSLNTISQLIRHPNLGPIILEQGQILVPGLWGPLLQNPYHKLPDLFEKQWQGRPPVYLVSHPMPKHYQDILDTRFNIKNAIRADFPVNFSNQRITVGRCTAPFQKFKALSAFITASLSTSSAAIIIACHSYKQIQLLEKRLSPVPVQSFHHLLSPEEKEIRLMHMLHQENPILLVESHLLDEIPSHLFAADKLNLVFWQLPWSCEAFSQHTLRAMHSNTKVRDILLLYSKEDYRSQKRWLSHQLSGQGISSIHIDHLNRMRHFCVYGNQCRNTQMEGWLTGAASQAGACGVCDNCIESQNSSLWRNLLKPILY